VSEQSQRDLSAFICKKPFEFASITTNNGVMLCCWVFKEVGKLSEVKTVLDVWNSPEAQEIRRSILDGSYRYCEKDICPHIHAGELPRKEDVKAPELRRVIDENLVVLSQGPAVYQFNNDRSCNLSCPSCRTELVFTTGGPDYEEKERIFLASINHETLASAREISITGTGDPFASRIYREFLLNLDGARYPNLRINLFTNGVLFDEKMWEKLHKIHRNIAHVRVSLDAVGEDVYNHVRRGGNLERVKRNVAFLTELRSRGFFSDLVLCFVVQAANFREMRDFARYAGSLPGVLAHFQRIYDWGTFPPNEFWRQDICDPANPGYAEFLRELRDPVFAAPHVELGNLTPFRELALANSAL
jgi:sulfatase maturation enzyme AslB (radical SAM superfamily)